MSNTPTQIRTIDPFAEYNSNVANRQTRMVSYGENALMSKNSLSLELDSTAPTTIAVVKTGSCFKDDVLIQVTADHQVDFEDPDNYYTVGELTESGTYYIVLDYTYVKSRPAPEAMIKIIKPSERPTTLPDSQVFLSVVNVVISGPVFRIDTSNAFANIDDEVGYEDNKRKYVKTYVGTETNLPTFEQFRDQSRMAYDSETDKFWLGYRNNWQEFGTGGSIINIDTTGTTVGQLCHNDSNGAAVPAQADDPETGADIAVKAVGLAIDSSGKGLTSGIAEDVPVEGAIVVTAGEVLYLSASEAGKVTNVKTSPYYQVVGRALTSRVGAGPIDMVFTPKIVLTTAVVGRITAPGDWSLDGGSGLYYYDIDISALDVDAELAVLTNFFEDSSDMLINPTDVEIRSSGDEVRVWMNVNNLSINYIVATGGGGNIAIGGGGGGSDHSLLSNLNYAASGHTGFAPDPHDNGEHSEIYITDAYNDLVSDSRIGTGATQVAQGDHTHGSGDIPSGSIMLFYNNAAPTGWTFQSITNNANIVLTNVEASGGSGGGSSDARSYDPTITVGFGGGHDHSISSQANHTHAGTTNNDTSSRRDEGGGSNTCTPRHNHTFTTGGGGSHSHGGNTGAEPNHNHTPSYSNYNPRYRYVIAASKD